MVIGLLETHEKGFPSTGDAVSASQSADAIIRLELGTENAGRVDKLTVMALLTKGATHDND